MYLSRSSRATGRVLIVVDYDEIGYRRLIGSRSFAIAGRRPDTHQISTRRPVPTHDLDRYAQWVHVTDSWEERTVGRN